MKKLLSLALAIAMIMSFAVVALAADPNPCTPLPVVADTGAGGVFSVSELYYKYSSDNAVMTMGATLPSIAYGNKIYFALVNVYGEIVSESDAVKSMTIKADWELGEELVKSIAIVKKKFVKEPKSLYGYFVEIALNSAPLETASSDLVGTLTLKKSTGDDEYKIDWMDENYFDFDVNIPVVYSPYVVEETTVLDVITKDPKMYDLEDVDDDEYEFTFTEIPDATFLVDVTGQKKIILKATADYNATIAGQYPLANLDFFNGNGATFNKIGELFIPADEGSFLYVVNSDGTLALSNAEYDSYEEGFFLKTRTLGSYVISDLELDLAAVEAPAEDVVEAVDDANTNPGTGAAL